MKQWNSVHELPTNLGPTVVTMGNFDGLHAGHQAVLATVVQRAAEVQATSVAITFEPHPLAVLRPEQAPPRVMSPEQRVRSLGEVGVQGCLVLPFTREFAQWPPERFVREVLVEALHAQIVVVGADARFGSRNAGDVHLLRRLGEHYGFTTVIVGDVGGDDTERWSSTQLRDLLAAGEVGRVAVALGRPHRVSGEVVRGDQRGRELGFPTANVSQHSEGMIPTDGVYAGYLSGESLPEPLPAAIHVGTNQTFGGTERRVEAYVIDRTGLELYGARVHVDFVQRVRGTEAFQSVDALVEQMNHDVSRCREILGFSL